MASSNDLLQSFSESTEEERERNNARAARFAAPDHIVQTERWCYPESRVRLGCTVPKAHELVIDRPQGRSLMLWSESAKEREA